MASRKSQPDPDLAPSTEDSPTTRITTTHDQSNISLADTALAQTSSTPSMTTSAATIPSTSTTSESITTSTFMYESSMIYRDCPSSNDAIYSVPNDSSKPALFRKACGYSFAGPNGESRNVVNTPAQSLDHCINLCAEYNVRNRTEIDEGLSAPCNEVCWRNRSPGDDFPYQCFGGTALNVSAQFNVNEEAICDSAAWINE